MTYQPAEWNKAFAEWSEKNPAEEKALRKQIGSENVRDYQTGCINNIGRVNAYRRAVMYKMTGIEAIKPAGYVDPDTLMASSIANGHSPRSALPLWLGRHNISKEEFAKTAGVDVRVVYGFIQGSPIKEAGEEKVLYALREYCAKYEQTSTHSPARAPMPAPVFSGQSETRASSKGLDELASQATRLVDAVRSLGGKVELHADAWKERGAYAMELLAEVMQHYADAKADERRAFVGYLKDQDMLATFGWSNNVLSGLLKGDDSPDVFARSFRPNRGGKR